MSEYILVIDEGTTSTLAVLFIAYVTAVNSFKRPLTKQFAELLGVKPEYISRIEAGKVDLQLSTLIRLSRGLNLQLVINPVVGV